MKLEQLFETNKSELKKVYQKATSIACRSHALKEKFSEKELRKNIQQEIEAISAIFLIFLAYLF